MDPTFNNLRATEFERYLQDGNQHKPGYFSYKLEQKISDLLQTSVVPLTRSGYHSLCEVPASSRKYCLLVPADSGEAVVNMLKDLEKGKRA